MNFWTYGYPNHDDIHWFLELNTFKIELIALSFSLPLVILWDYLAYSLFKTWNFKAAFASQHRIV